MKRMYNTDVYHIYAPYNGIVRHYAVTLEMIGTGADGKDVYKASLVYVNNVSNNLHLTRAEAVVYMFTTDGDDLLNDCERVVEAFHEELRSKYVEVEEV